MSQRLLTWTLTPLLLAAIPAAPARADDASDRKATAQVLFEQGREAVSQGHFAEACPKLAESQRLDPGIGTGLWLADCYENNGQTASAWVTFKEAAAAAALRHDDREQVARGRASKLEPRLSRLVILVPAEAAAQGLDLRRDGLAVGVSQWGVAIPVDPGVHSIAATAPGRQPWSTNVKLEPQPATLQVTVPVLASAPVQQTTNLDTVSRGADPPSSTQAALVPEVANTGSFRSDNTRRHLGLVTVGVGVAALGAGTVLGLMAKSTYDASNAGHCLPNNECDATGKQDRSNAFALATGSTVSMIAGAAVVFGGALLYFTAPRDVSVGVSPTRIGQGATIGITAGW